MAQVPSPLATVVPTTASPSRMVIVAPASAPDPEMLWVRLFVVSAEPLITGALGAVVSIASRLSVALPVLPAPSVSLADTTTTSVPEKAPVLAV